MTCMKLEAISKIALNLAYKDIKGLAKVKCNFMFHTSGVFAVKNFTKLTFAEKTIPKIGYLMTFGHGSKTGRCL